MSDLTNIERIKLEKFLGMEGGYVLNFVNRTFNEFFLENFNVDIFDSKYDYASGSKANRLRAFWRCESNTLVGQAIMALLDYWKVQKQLQDEIISVSERDLFDECEKIAKRLSNNVQNCISYSNTTKDSQLKQLLLTFEALENELDHQKRGYALEKLLNKLFKINNIPIVDSFKRNNNAEQIDGAFNFQNWFYLVECKWTGALADIKELDSLKGKISRSGKQTMGLFLSVMGWSKYVPSLLKQNPDKSIILMEGCDLRYVLSEDIGLSELLSKKIEKLNFDAEPFYSVMDILNSKK